MENDGSLCGTGALRVNIDFLQGPGSLQSDPRARLTPELLWIDLRDREYVRGEI